MNGKMKPYARIESDDYPNDFMDESHAALNAYCLLYRPANHAYCIKVFRDYISKPHPHILKQVNVNRFKLEKAKQKLILTHTKNKHGEN